MKFQPLRRSFRILTASIASVLGVSVLAPSLGYGQAISISAPTNYTQNFNTLGLGNVFWTNNSTIPGWYAEINNNGTPTGSLQATNGATDFNGLLNLGSTGSTDRAIGSKVTGTGGFANVAYGVLFRNTSDTVLRVSSVAYAGELWRGNTGSISEHWHTFYQISGAPITDLESGFSSDTPEDGSFFALPALNWTSPATSAVLDGNTAGRTLVSLNNPDIIIQPNAYFMFRWVDTNLAGTDGHQGIDDFAINFSFYRRLTYNLNHTVGGAPNGTLAVSAAKYWLNGGVTPDGLQALDDIVFSQAGDATINVPSNINLGIVSAENFQGTYTVGGAGRITGTLNKSNDGTLVLTSPNNFTGTVYIAGGTLETRASGALGATTINLSAFSTLRTTTLAQTHTGNLVLETGGGTVRTETNFTINGGIIGTSGLVKSGPGTLTFTGTGTSAAGITIEEGTLSVPNFASIGTTAQSITLGGGALEIPTTGTLNYNDAATPRLLNAGSTGAFSVPNTTLGNAVVIARDSSVNGGGSIAKTGAGTLRLSAAQPFFTGEWIINGGFLEETIANSFGSGAITINPTGTLAVQNLSVSNPINLSGGNLGTRTGDSTIYAGPVDVLSDSNVALRSSISPSVANNITISGVLSGHGGLSLTGTTPLFAGNTKTLVLTNSANSYSGTFTVTSQQNLTSQPAGGTGNTLGTGTVLLRGGALLLRDNGTGSNGTMAYGAAIATGAPTDAVQPGVSTINANRQSGANAGNTIAFGSLTMGTHTLAFSGGNNYKVSFNGGTFNGDATLQTDGTLVPVLLGNFGGTGSLTKTGGGSLTFAGTGAYTGVTNVNGGTLALTGALPGSPRIDVKTGATFDVAGIAGGFTLPAAQTISGTGTVNGLVIVGNGAGLEPGNLGAGTLTMSNLTFGSAAGQTGAVRFVLEGTPGKLIIAGNNGLTLNGGGNSVTLNIGGASLPVGTYTLLDYTGAIQGTGFTGFKLGTLPARAAATLVNNAANTSVDLQVTGLDFPIWTGALSSEWSTATLSDPKNWVLNSNNNVKTDFLSNDKVVFDDLATAPLVTVNVADVTVSDLTFNNTVNEYTVSGSKAIAGPASLTKNGSGLVILNTTNTFTGNANLNAGTLRIAAIANAGTASPLGAGTAMVFNGGTLEFTGASGTTNRAITLNAGGGTVKTDTALTLAGAITGSGALIKTGTGTVTVTGTNAYGGTTTVSAGKLNVGGGGASGTLGTGGVANEGVLVFDRTDAVTIANTITGGGSVEKRNTNTTTLGGTQNNTSTGPTTVFAGTLIAGKPAGINAIGGNLILETGGTFRYLNNNVSNQIADTATILVNGGTFGDPLAPSPTNPGAWDTVANVTLNSGFFGSGRNTVITGGVPTLNSFTVTNTISVAGGTMVAQRGGSIFGGTVQLSGGAINLDGGGDLPGEATQFIVGAGGFQLTGGTLALNSGPGSYTSSSGSILKLQGNFTSSGTHTIQRQNMAFSSAQAAVDLAGGNRTFDVTGALNLGTAAAPIRVSNGALTKSGPGILTLPGDNNFSGATIIAAGTLVLTGALSGTSGIEVKAGAEFDVTAFPSAFNLGVAQSLTGAGLVDGPLAVAGVLAPGPGTANLTFTSNLTLGGTANFEISKLGLVRSSDLASVGGTLTLGGTLNVTASGDALSVGDAFNLFDAATFTGNFAAINLPALSGGMGWNTEFLATNGFIIVAVPEPSGALLLLGGLGVLLGRRRRAIYSIGLTV
jgi:autotransporter-associated beta strand protein